MLKYLEDTYGERATMGDKGNLEFLRSEANRLEGLVQKQREQKKGEAEVKSARGSEQETDEDVSGSNS